MQIGKKLFPYPTINNSKVASCYKNSVFSFIYDDVEDESNLVLKNARIELNNETLIKLLNEEKAEAIVVIECSSTVFRTVREINTEPRDIKIPLEFLRDRVVVSCFIYAKEQFNYINEDFLDEYDGYSFEIEKYYILAIDDGFTTKIEYDEDKDKKLSSIFSIIKSLDPNIKAMKIESTNKKIKIILPEKQFELYDNLKRNESFQYIFFSVLAIPALIKCLQELKTENGDLEMIRMDNSWFESIMKAYKKVTGKELTNEEFAEVEVEIMAQNLLDGATLKSISDIFDISFNKNILGGEFDE